MIRFLHFLAALTWGVLLFLLCVPLTILGVFVVPLALLRPDNSQKAATYKTDGVHEWWLQTLPRWAYLWDNPYDGSLGDEHFRWAGKDIPFGWKNTGFLARWWWLAMRNPLHRFKSFIICCDIRLCKFFLLAGQPFVRDRADATGYQLALAVRNDGALFWRIYWVWKWPWWPRAAIVEIGHEFRADHWQEDYSGREFKNFKGFAFLIHPCKPI